MNQRKDDTPENALVPIFGSHCRTESFAFKHPNAGTSQYLHFEMVRENPNDDSWTVQRITQTANSRTGQSYVSIEKQAARLTFAAAVRELSLAENHLRGRPNGFTPVYPDAAAMGFLHFRAFAEREGYVFDTAGRPWPRPAADALPAPGAHVVFDQADITRADANLQRPAGEFGPAAPSRKLPNTLFIFDAFNRNALGKKAEGELAGLRVMNLLDQFVRKIEAMDKALHDYASAHLRPDAQRHINTAEYSLTQARHDLRQIKAYGIDTAAFEKFADECAIVLNVVHAQGLYDQLRRQSGSFDDLEAQFKKRASAALDLYSQLERADAGKGTPAQYAQGRQTLQEMMIQGGTPAIPEAIGEFTARYHAQRKAMIDAKKPAPPAPPKP